VFTIEAIMIPVRIVVFAKAPLPGVAKTRLIPALGAQGAADLAQRMLAHTLAQAQAAGVGPVELCVSPNAAEPVWQELRPLHTGAWSDQGEGDLGARMARAARRAIDAGESVLLIGTDCPALDGVRLRQAAEALQQADACLIAAFDGGYVLLGLTRFDATIFSGMAWSSDSVARETLRRLAKLDWSVRSLPALHDVDEPGDLQWLPGARLP